jgi:hypothetical protein
VCHADDGCVHAVEDEQFGQDVTEELRAVPAAGWWFDRGLGE